MIKPSKNKDELDESHSTVRYSVADECEFERKINRLVIHQSFRKLDAEILANEEQTFMNS